MKEEGRGEEREVSYSSFRLECPIFAFYLFAKLENKFIVSLCFTSIFYLIFRKIDEIGKLIFQRKVSPLGTLSRTQQYLANYCLWSPYFCLLSHLPSLVYRLLTPISCTVSFLPWSLVSCLTSPVSCPMCPDLRSHVFFLMSPVSHLPSHVSCLASAV